MLKFTDLASSEWFVLPSNPPVGASGPAADLLTLIRLSHGHGLQLDDRPLDAKPDQLPVAIVALQHLIGAAPPSGSGPFRPVCLWLFGGDPGLWRLGWLLSPLSAPFGGFGDSRQGS